LCRCDGEGGGEYSEGNVVFHDKGAVYDVMVILADLLFAIGEIDPTQIENAAFLRCSGVRDEEQIFHYAEQTNKHTFPLLQNLPQPPLR
jgi:hypothetical protein